MSGNCCVVADSACDLPNDYIQNHGIEILPISVRLGGDLFVDVRDPKITMELYRQGIDVKGIDAESIPFTTEQIAQLLESRIAPRYEAAQIITITATRSPIYENARQASVIHMTRLKAARKASTGDEHFSLRVLDSKTLFTGEAVLVYEAVRLLEQEQLPFTRLTARLEALRDKVYAYLIPRDLYYIHSRGKKKGDSSVSWLSYKIGTLLDVKPVIQAHRGETEAVFKATGFDGALERLLQHAAGQIRRGLSVPVVTMSYSGNLSELGNHHMIRKFREFATRHRVETLLSVMSTTAAINVGPGSFSLAFAAG